MDSTAQNAAGVTDRDEVMRELWWDFETAVDEVVRLRLRLAELEHEVKQAHRSADDAIAANQRTLDTVAELVSPGAVMDDAQLVEAVRELVSLREVVRAEAAPDDLGWFLVGQRLVRVTEVIDGSERTDDENREHLEQLRARRRTAVDLPERFSVKVGR